MVEDTTTKRTINRSTAYPGISLEEAVEATKLLRTNLGSGPYSRESAAQALGYAGVSGASGTKVAACVHFGFLSRDGNVYRQSELAKKLFVFIPEDEKQEALRIAVQKPALYAKLIETYSGSALPSMLSNILTRNYGITERVAKDAAATFIKSAEYAGILKNGVLTLETTEDKETSRTPSGEYTVTTPISVPTLQSTSTQQTTFGQHSPHAHQDYLPIEIPDTEIKVLFPLKYAYALSVGAFKSGIEALAKNVEGVEDTERTNVAQVINSGE